MLWENVAIVTGRERRTMTEEEKPAAFYIKATAGKKAEWQPITIKNSTAEHQSPIVAGMKPKIWHTLTQIWLGVQISLQLDSCWEDHAVQKTKKKKMGGKIERKKKGGRTTKRHRKRGRENVSWQNEWMSFWLQRTVGLWSNILTGITHHFTSLKSH